MWHVSPYGFNFLHYITIFALFMHRSASFRILVLLGSFCQKIREGRRLRKHRNGRELNQFILYNKIHFIVVLISSTNTSQHQTLMRGFQLDSLTLVLLLSHLQLSAIKKGQFNMIWIIHSKSPQLIYDKHN